MTAETFRCGHPKTPENCGVRPNGETWCRACSRIRAKAYRVANPEKAKASHKAWLEANREDQLAKGRARMKARRVMYPEIYEARQMVSREQRLTAERARKNAIRLEATERYGSACVMCGRPGTLGVELELDHIDGGGRAERRELTGGQGGARFYRVLRGLGWPDGYQSLCGACHQAKTVATARLDVPCRRTVWADQIRSQATAVYGDRCVECGWQGSLGRGLQLDHVNNDGAEHRRELFGDRNAGGVRYYSKLKKLGWPREGLQVLCVTCHKARTRAENQRLADEAWAARLAGGAPEPPVGSPAASDILTGTDGPPAVEKPRKALS